jgi:hypothetical protein
MDFGMEIAIVRFSRLLQTGAFSIEKPAMKWTAQTAIFQPSISQIGAPVRAAPPHQGIISALLPVQHQILTHQVNRNGWPLIHEFVSQSGRLPVAPQ